MAWNSHGSCWTWLGLYIYISDLDFFFDEWVQGLGLEDVVLIIVLVWGECAVGIRGCGLEVGEVGCVSDV